MSSLKKAYEISIWRDEQISGAQFTEKRIAVIGADEMDAECRAQTPKLKKGINGSKELTFKLYRKYRDRATGEQLNNPFVDLIANETKIKLKYRDKWYDLIVKNIQQDSSNNTLTYTATDLFANELSKNGYGVTLDESLMNNMGTLSELSAEALRDTGWEIEIESSPKQYIAEQLIKLTNPSGQVVYGFYSSCKDQPLRFQYVTNLGNLDEEGIYSNPTQTFLDMKGRSYTTDSFATQYGFSYPVGYSFVEITQHRANKIVYTHKSKFNPALNKVVYSYNSGEVEGYTKTEYVSPNLIQNLVTNNSFKSTSGWQGSYISSNPSLSNQGSTENALVEALALSPSGKNLIDAFVDGSFLTDTSSYVPCLKATFQTSNSVLVNSGFYDNRNAIKNLAPGQRFVLLYKPLGANTTFTATVGVSEYSVQHGHYMPLTQSFLVFDSRNSTTYQAQGDYLGYRYIVAEVPATYEIVDEKAFKKLKTQIFIRCGSGSTCGFYDFQIFAYVKDPLSTSDTPLLPENSAKEATAVTEYYYYKPEENLIDPSAAGYRATEQEYKYCAKSTISLNNYVPDYTSEKIGSISVKQSNYFNIIQALCEKFEVWADFVVEHDSIGRILSKTILFKENLTKPNHVGFRYGVNLKSSKRTLDSKAIVTKLIVPDNSNQYAPNGFCSIARAGANLTGENYLYDFSYYYNFGMLDRATTNDLLLRPRTSGDSPLQGYYVELLKLNSQLTTTIDRYSALAKPLMQAEANKQVAEAGKVAAEDSYREAADAFIKIAGYGHTEISTPEDLEEVAARLDQIENNASLKEQLIKISEYYTAWQKYIVEESQAESQYISYKALNDELLSQIEQLNNEKESLNKLFYKSFYRFIQEGTWKSEEHTDNEKYYNDAYTTLQNSSLPKVTYTFNVFDLSQIEGYEVFEFDLGELTWVEDPELFGESREEVVITEVTYSLDDPSQNSVKIQNYRNQFADLFQKVTATTQQVQYSSGTWEKAGAFANSEPTKQAAFLQNALEDAEMRLQNAGEQSVVWDKTGITVTDLGSPNQQLRIIGGAILLRDQDNDGLGWKVGITPKGISAKLLTAGQINTSVISIMNGDEPYFRWDAFGISAYYFDTDNKGMRLNGLDTKKGVRFDRFGIYGYSGPDGATWHPNSLKEVQNNSMFALTWDGLFLKLGQGSYTEGFDMSTGEAVPLGEYWHLTTSRIGKAGKYVYNTWVDGYPSYDPSLATPTFVKVLTVGDGEENEQLVIYDDGTLVANNVKFTGSVTWVPEASPSRSVYGPIELADHKPRDKWYYKDVPEHDPGEEVPKEERWHRVKSPDDVLYCHTDTAGAIWEGHFLISGRSIKETIAEYAVTDSQVGDPGQITNWSLKFPVEIPTNSYLYMRVYDKYDDNTQSSYRYSFSFYSTEGSSPYAIDLSNDAATITATADGQINESTLAIISKVVVTVWHGTTDITNSCICQWEASGGTLKETSGRQNNLIKMSEDQAVVTILITQGQTLIGTKTFTISKAKQGEDSILCYVHSSMGNLFESTQEGNTTLTAYIYSGSQELDANGTEFIYSWYIQEEDSGATPTPQPNLNSKQVSIPMEQLINKKVYFIATSKQ